MHTKFIHGILLSIVLCATVAVAQTSTQKPPNPVLLTVNVEGAQPLRLTADDLGKLPRRSVNAKDHDGKDTSFEGVDLGEVLTLAGVKLGEHLRGKELALFLLVEAADGYRAVFALPELNPAFTHRLVILADRREGKPLGEKEGPVRIVVPGEKRQARWVRQVTSLTIRRAN